MASLCQGEKSEMSILQKTFSRLCRISRLPKGVWDFLLDSVSYFLRMTRIIGKPVNATIELTNACDLRCPVCETGAGLLTRKKGSMPLSRYKIIIDKIAEFTNSILLYYMGEPFLNKDIYEIIRYTKNKKIFIKVCTNGESIDPLPVLLSGLDEIQIQIGGTTQETHSRYRKEGILDKSLYNVERLIAERKKLIKNNKRVNTHIYLGLIVMKHNESQIDDFFNLAKRIQVDGARLESPCVRNIEQGKIFLPQNPKYWIYDIAAFKAGILRHAGYKKNHCRWIYYSITITWEGDLIPCCRDVDAKYKCGNLFDNDFHLIWNGLAYRKFRRMVLSHSESIPMCLLCDGFTFPSLESVA